MPAYSDHKLHETLRRLGVVDNTQLDNTFWEGTQKKIPLAEALTAKGLISEQHLGQIISDLLSIPFIDLAQIAIPPKTLNIIPEIVAKNQKIIAFERSKEGLKVAMTDPKNLEIKEFIEKKVGDEVIPYFATENALNTALNLYRKGLKEEFSEIIAASQRKAEEQKEGEAPIRKIVDTIIEHAYHNKASDIHIEPHEENSIVRFRIDGALFDEVTLSRAVHTQVVALIKVMARLRTDEHFAPQDGKIVYRKIEDEALDIRVSIVPLTDGEKVVMRLLSERSRQINLESLGLGGADFEKLHGALKRSHGMILATGPTGSGKTTTLYAILKILNQRDVNISTIEDPVEYDIEGVNQIQVNTKTELTFAKGLRSIVRQDPDIILVGEVRDEETAGIAVNSAMTGHLVLSTLHTNDAATTLPRLLDMKIEPFLVASTVNIIIAQRLVRKICMKCRVSKEIGMGVEASMEMDGGSGKGNPQSISTSTSKPASKPKPTFQLPKELIKKHFGEKEKIRIYKGKGCKVCQGIGYSGRVGIFEVLPMDDDIRQAVVERKDSDSIQALAVQKGMTVMLDDGLDKVARGITTIEEVLRVVKT